MNPNFILIFLSLALGIGLKASGKLNKNAHQSFNAFVIWISLPSVILLQIPLLLKHLEINGDLFIPVSMSWILFGLSFVTFYYLGKFMRWSQAETGALVLTAGLGNTSFVGFPILESLYGAEGVRIGVLVDQPGTFLVLSTVGILFASAMSPHEGREFKISNVARNILTFPPFVALILAFFWHLSGTYEPGPFITVLERLAGTLVPLALVAVGFQLKFSPSVMRRQWKPLCLGLGFKLFLAPLFFIGLYIYILGSHSFATKITILEAAMAPMITASVVSDEFGFNPEISNLMVGIGIPLSILTVYLWNQLPILQF